MTEGIRQKPTLSVDFDGVIHTYENGWQDGKIYGDVVDGFVDWLYSIEPHFRVVVHTSRSIRQVYQWLEERGLNLVVSSEKPPSWAVIDDRAIRFNGNWNDPQLSAEALMAFRPWNVKPKEPEE